VKLVEAQRVLGLVSDYDEPDVLRAYRCRATVTHPDRGGDAAGFNDALQARDTLILWLRQPRGAVVIEDTGRWRPFLTSLLRRRRKPTRHLL
jgi:hypothetical protein